MARCVIFLPLIALAGCTVGPDYVPPRPAVAPGWVEPALPGEVDSAWWRSFGDPQLTALVERALAASPDLREAQARLAEARANRDAVRGGALPQLRVSGAVTENVLSKNGQLPLASIPGFEREFTLFDLGFDASWELDFWGRNRRQAEAADARADAALWGRRDATVALLAEIARNYVDLRGRQAELALIEQRLAAQGELARLTRLRFDAGEANRMEAEQAEALRATIAAARDGVAARSAAAAYRIAVLAGEAPEALVPALRDSAPIPQPPVAITSGVRSELLRRRPDVRRAERELAAANADIGVATADLFPRFSLLGSIGQQARDAGDLASGGSTRLSAGPSFSWPVFSGGRIRASIRAADARTEAATARYDRAVLGALADSEAAANRFANASSAALETAGAVRREREAHRLAMLRFEKGEDDRMALARSTLRLLDARDREREAIEARSSAAIALYKALGGGWDETPPQSAQE